MTQEAQQPTFSDFFLDPSIKRFQSLTPVRLRLLPFPDFATPELLLSTQYFIERIRTIYYLRHTASPYFCQKLFVRNYEFEVEAIDDDGDLQIDAQGAQVYNHHEVACLVASFEDEERTVGYWFDDESQLTLHCFSTEEDINLLRPTARFVYYSAYYGTRAALEKNDLSLETNF